MAQRDEHPQRMGLPLAVKLAAKEDAMVWGSSQMGENKEI
jgi:hypothetical protein